MLREAIIENDMLHWLILYFGESNETILCVFAAIQFYAFPENLYMLQMSAFRYSLIYIQRQTEKKESDVLEKRNERKIF